MKNAISFLIILWGLKLFFSTSFSAIDSAAKQVVQAIGTAAAISEANLLKMK